MFARYCWIFVFLSSPVFAAPQIQNWQTSNGARVYFVEAHELPMVDIQLNFDAGSARDPEQKKGLATLTNSLLDEGAAQLSAHEISYEFERLGAIYGANAGYDSASVSLRSLVEPNKLDSALNNLRRVIAKPDFPAQALQRQRNRFLVGIQQKKQSPAALAQESFYKAIYSEHPYAYPKEGTVESISGIDRADIVAFHARYYVAANAIMAIVGDLDRSRAERLAEQLSQSLPAGKKAAAIAPVAALEQANEIRIIHPSSQTHILLGQPGMKRNDPDFFPLYVGNHILGGSGLVSMLFREIREKRALSYSAYSYFSPMREYGPFLAGLSTRADQSDKAVEVLRETIRSFIKDGPDRAALEAARKNITGGFPLRLDSNSNILAYVALIGFYNLPMDYLETFNEKVEAVTVADIKDAFARRVFPEKLVTVMVGPDSTERQQTD